MEWGDFIFNVEYRFCRPIFEFICNFSSVALLPPRQSPVHYKRIFSHHVIIINSWIKSQLPVETSTAQYINYTTQQLQPLLSSALFIKINEILERFAYTNIVYPTWWTNKSISIRSFRWNWVIYNICGSTENPIFRL